MGTKLEVLKSDTGEQKSNVSNLVDLISNAIVPFGIFGGSASKFAAWLQIGIKGRWRRFFGISWSKVVAQLVRASSSVLCSAERHMSRLSSNTLLCNRTTYLVLYELTVLFCLLVLRTGQRIAYEDGQNKIKSEPPSKRKKNLYPKISVRPFTLWSQSCLGWCEENKSFLDIVLYCWGRPSLFL